MLFQKQLHIPAKTRMVTDYYKCELCDKTSRTIRNWENVNSYALNETKVEMRVGAIYPEGGTYDTTTIDICTTCFTDKLIPWIKSQGGEIRVEDHDS